MSRKEKLLKRFLSRPKDFTFDEAETLLNSFEFYLKKAGKTGGSRVKFVNEDFIDVIISFHKPHPSNILKAYVLEAIEKGLRDCNLLESEVEDEEE